jgi:hypothetical protein
LILPGLGDLTTSPVINAAHLKTKFISSEPTIEKTTKIVDATKQTRH